MAARYPVFPSLKIPSAPKDEPVQLDQLYISIYGILGVFSKDAMLAVLLILFFVFLSVYYLCAKWRLNKKNSAVYHMLQLSAEDVRIMKCWLHI